VNLMNWSRLMYDVHRFRHRGMPMATATSWKSWNSTWGCRCSWTPWGCGAAATNTGDPRDTGPVELWWYSDIMWYNVIYIYIYIKPLYYSKCDWKLQDGGGMPCFLTPRFQMRSFSKWKFIPPRTANQCGIWWGSLHYINIINHG